MIPSWDSLRPSSRSEQSIPKDFIPRTFDALIFVPSGIMVPTGAKAVMSPSRTFGAPQTIVSVSSPVSTSQRWSLSALG